MKSRETDTGGSWRDEISLLRAEVKSYVAGIVGRDANIQASASMVEALLTTLLYTQKFLNTVQKTEYETLCRRVFQEIKDNQYSETDFLRMNEVRKAL